MHKHVNYHSIPSQHSPFHSIPWPSSTSCQPIDYHYDDLNKCRMIFVTARKIRSKLNFNILDKFKAIVEKKKIRKISIKWTEKALVVVSIENAMDLASLLCTYLSSGLTVEQQNQKRREKKRQLIRIWNDKHISNERYNIYDDHQEGNFQKYTYIDYKMTGFTIWSSGRGATGKLSILWEKHSHTCKLAEVSIWMWPLPSLYW